MSIVEILPPCPPPIRGLLLFLDGPLSFVVINLGIFLNTFCLFILFRSSMNMEMLVGFTALAIWDVILLLTALIHHSLWATLYFFGYYPWHNWDNFWVTLDGLLECAHISSTWMLLLVTTTRFLAVARPFQTSSKMKEKERFLKKLKRAFGMVRLPLALTLAAMILTLPCTFEHELLSCEIDGIEISLKKETEWSRNIYYSLIYKNLLLAFLKTFGPAIVIIVLTVNTLSSMKESIDSRADILRQQGKGLLFETDKDKKKALKKNSHKLWSSKNNFQIISTILLGKFLCLRCWPSFLTITNVLFNEETNVMISRIAEFTILFNAATNCVVFVLIKSFFERRRTKKFESFRRQQIIRHAQQLLSIGKMLAVKHEEKNNDEEDIKDEGYVADENESENEDKELNN